MHIIINFSQRMIEVLASDIDFYEGKIKTLEQDNFYMHEEIMKLRTRLRTAEDFEIKYSLLVSANQRQIERLRASLQRQEEERMKDILCAKLKQNDDHWLNHFKDFEAKLKNEAEANIEALRKQLTAKNQQLADIKSRSEESELFGFKINKLEKENQLLKTEIQQIKIFHEKQRNEEITKLRTTLNSHYREKIESEQKKHSERIAEMQNRLYELEVKDDNVTYVASPATNRELTSLKALFEQKSKQYAKQLKQCHELSTVKNEEISKILRERIEIDEKYRLQSQQKNQYIKQLENKILQRQKSHEMELLNQLERTKKAKDQEKQQLLDQINHLNSEISRFQQLFNQKILNHQAEIEELNNKFEDDKRKLSEDKNMNKRKISQLSLKIKEAQGDRQIGETEMLINSLRDIDIKGDQLGSYENGITFLQRVNKKCQLKLQQKSRIVSKLYKDINDIRAQAQRQIAELKQKIRKDRKQNAERILLLENQVRDLSDKLRIKEKQSKKRERQFLKEKTDLEQQKTALKEMNDELQRDYNRVIQGKKDVETSYREQRQKSFTSRSDLNLIKKQKWLQLQKQKNELHIIFKEKEEQIKLEYEQPLDDLKNEINKLKQDFQITKQQNLLLKKENEKFRELQESNKENDKMSEYNKKMASLNLELALTQNIYESLKKAKSRIDPSFSPAEFSADIDERSEVESPLMMSFHPSANAFK